MEKPKEPEKKPEEKHSEEKKAEDKKVDEKKHGKKIVNHIQTHLARKISIPVFVILAIVILALIPVPYTAKESYTEIRDVVDNVSKVVPDLNHPYYDSVCEDFPLNVTVTTPYVFGKPIPDLTTGLSKFKCYSEFKVSNKGTADGKWTYRFVFNIGGKMITTEPVTELIPKYSSMTFSYETDQCKEGDELSGSFELISGPTYQDCRYVQRYLNVTVVEPVTRQVNMSLERLVSKKETVWQWIIGYNRAEKV